MAVIDRKTGGQRAVFESDDVGVRTRRKLAKVDVRTNVEVLTAILHES
jgi:hypothetical protein